MITANEFKIQLMDLPRCGTDLERQIFIEKTIIAILKKLEDKE